MVGPQVFLSFDGRKLNFVTIKYTYPIIQIDCILNEVRDAEYLTSVALHQPVFQTPRGFSAKNNFFFI